MAFIPAQGILKLIHHDYLKAAAEAYMLKQPRSRFCSDKKTGGIPL